MPLPKTIIFDLSEVLIAGLLGIEEELSQHCPVTRETALAHLGGDNLWRLCRGQLTEEEYLDHAYSQSAWTLPREQLRRIIRHNFTRKVPGSEQLLLALHARFELVLLSDHAREWVEHIRSLHPFLDLFSSRHFSFEIGAIKAEPASFEFVLKRIGRTPGECLFIDDSERNIRVAASLGIDSIRFTSAAELSAELRQRGLL
jgi:HAD superfamily hydrolase (TIGR01509 family)